MSSFYKNTAGFRNALRENLGFRGVKNLAAWGVAGTIAYYLWVKPEQKAEAERRAARERMAAYAKERGIEDVDRVRPVAGACGISARYRADTWARSKVNMMVGSAPLQESANV